MRRALIAFAVLLACSIAVTSLHAQSATLTTPETVTATKLVVSEVDTTRTSASVTVEFQTAGGVVKRTATFGTSSLAELSNFLTVTSFTTRSGEVGTDVRKYNFRVLGWLFDNNKFKDEAGNPPAVSLVP